MSQRQLQVLARLEREFEAERQEQENEEQRTWYSQDEEND